MAWSPVAAVRTELAALQRTRAPISMRERDVEKMVADDDQHLLLPQFLFFEHCVAAPTIGEIKWLSE